MKSPFQPLAVFLLFCGLIGIASAQTTPSNGSRVNPENELIEIATPILPPLTINSPYWLAVDFASRQIIGQSGAEVRIEPASMTKVMTAYLVFQALREGKLREEEEVQPIKFTEGSRMFLDDRQKVSVKALIYGMIVQSGNDASITLATLIAGNEANFAIKMNDKASSLGMNDTHFVNATGLPHPQHYTTLKDLAKLARALIRDFPEYYPIYAEREFTYNKITQPNRNALLWRNIGADGIKTGHTESAGFCLMASAIRQERRVIVITARAAIEQQRFADSETIIHALYDHSQTIKIYEREQILQTLPVWKGAQDTVNVGFNQPLYMTIPQGMSEKISAKLSYSQPLLAPIKTGQVIGQLEVSLDGKSYANYPVQALQEVTPAGWFKLMWANFRLWLKF